MPSLQTQFNPRISLHASTTVDLTTGSEHPFKYQGVSDHDSVDDYNERSRHITVEFDKGEVEVLRRM